MNTVGTVSSAPCSTRQRFGTLRGASEANLRRRSKTVPADSQGRTKVRVTKRVTTAATLGIARREHRASSRARQRHRTAYTPVLRDKRALRCLSEPVAERDYASASRQLHCEHRVAVERGQTRGAAVTRAHLGFAAHPGEARRA